MEKISDISVSDFSSSEYIKPLRIHYTQNGQPKTWDIVKMHDSVSVVIYNVSRNVLVFVRQFRPAAYFNGVREDDQLEVIGGSVVDTVKYPPRSGITLELCAGIVDKDTSLEDIAGQELLEECGYAVPISSLQHVVTYSGVGITGDRQSLFYVEVTDSMKTSKGGGNADEGELIEVVEMTVDETRNYVRQQHVLSPAGFLFGVTWFLANKVKADPATN